MKRKKVLRTLLLVIMLAIFATYVWLRVENSQYIREPRATFGDTNDYFQMASLPVFSPDFWLSVKPPVVSLFLKILGNNVVTIATFQLWFSIACWGLLAYLAADALKHAILKPVAFGLLLAFSLSEEIIMWDYLILSDSIALSLLTLFLSASLLALRRWNKTSASLFIIMAVILAFARDTYAYVLLMVAAGLLVIFVVSRWQKPFLIIGIVLILIFFASSALADAGLHWYTPLLNTIGMRIVPNQDYLAYFEARGMPVNEALMERSGKPHHAGYGEMVFDDRLEEFRTWVREEGKSEYTRFLWFYKEDTLQNLFNDRPYLFSPDLTFYTATRFRPIIQNARLDELLFPNRFGFIVFLASNLIGAALAVVAIYEKRTTWILPILLILLTYPQAFLIWNADASDIARHAMYHNVMMRLGIWMMVIYGLDFILEKIRLPRVNR